MPPVYKVRTADQTITDISQYFRLYRLDVATNAEEGSVAQSTVQADDPLGAFDIGGHRIFTVQEDAATGSNTHIYVGYTAARRISRGDYSRTTTGRVWDIDLTDLNTVLSRRIFDGTRANRPAETDVARIQWLLTTEEAANYIDDSLYLNTSNAVAMDAVDYRGQSVANVIDDCAQSSGKNWFVWYREETGEFSLWYDFASSESYSSPLRLTNVLSEVDSAWTFAISPDTSLSRSPDRVNSGAYLPYDGGAVYVRSITTAAEFAFRDAVMPAENVKSLAKATARASRYLGTMDSEEDVITTTLTLPAAKVNLLMQGMRVQFKATHLPGYEGYTWARLLNRSVLQVSEEFYEVKCEMSVEPSQPIPEVGAGVLYGGQDNGWEVYINGTVIDIPGTHDFDDNNIPITVPDGILTPGDNVVAVRITNGVEPAGWSVGNEMFVEIRLFDDASNLLCYSSTSAKVWWVSWMGEDGLTFTNVGGNPSGWETAAFDDSAWENAIDVTGTTANLSAIAPISPARLIAMDDLTVGRFSRGAKFLARINFTI